MEITHLDMTHDLWLCVVRLLNHSTIRRIHSAVDLKKNFFLPPVSNSSAESRIMNAHSSLEMSRKAEQTRPMLAPHMVRRPIALSLSRFVFDLLRYNVRRSVINSNYNVNNFVFIGIGLFSGTVSTLCNKHSVEVSGEGVSVFSSHESHENVHSHVRHSATQMCLVEETSHSD